MQKLEKIFFVVKTDYKVVNYKETEKKKEKKNDLFIQKLNNFKRRKLLLN